MLVDQSWRVVCGARVGANRCRLDPHTLGRHDVAPDRLWVRLEMPLREHHLSIPVSDEQFRGSRRDVVAEIARGMRAVSYTCPATARQCSCQPGERCLLGVRRG